MEQPELRQHVFALNFQVNHLLVTLSKSDGVGGEKLLGDVSFDRFALGFTMAKYDMKVDVNLRYVLLLVSPASSHHH